MAFDAVIFDLGGVILPSPFEAWARYETELGLEVGFLRRVVAAGGEASAWARHERGEIDFAGFCDAFEAECAAAGGEAVSGAEVMARLAADPEPRPQMLQAVTTIRAAGYRTGALTNNWAPIAGTSPAVDALAGLFEVIVESSVEGLRKPDPAIYLLTCERLGVTPERSVFLDDLGMNLKPARALGMTTIKVDDPAAALAELGDTLGLRLP